MHFRSNIRLLCLIFLIIIPSVLSAQNGTCPYNIGFEDGSFQGWQCYIGKIENNGNVSMAPSPAIDSLHTIFQRNIPPVVDKYGFFPVNSPNGSNYSIRLGDSESGSNAERVSYTFTVPPNQDNYS